MDNKFDKAKEKYMDIEIPKELDEIVNNAIKRASDDSEITQFKKEKKMNRIFTKVAAIGLIGVSALTIGLNTSESFALSMEDIPVIGSFARLLTFVDYQVDDGFIDAKVAIPKVDGLGNAKLEDKVNKEISEKMNSILEDAKERAREYKTAFIETGGKEEDFRRIYVEIDYELIQSTDRILSFKVYHFESLASSYSDTFYYNIDLENEREFTLTDLLGEDYKQIVDADIASQIAEMKKDEMNSFFDGDEGFTGITEDQRFYINKDNKVVICFPKYAIAPGYMGELEFVINSKINN